MCFVFIFEWTPVKALIYIHTVYKTAYEKDPLLPASLGFVEADLSCMYRGNQSGIKQFHPYPRNFHFLNAEGRRWPFSFFSGLHCNILQKAGIESLATSGKPKHYFNGRSDQISRRNLTMTDAISTEQFTIYYHRRSAEEGECWQKSILFQANCFWDECQLLTL